MCVCVFFGLAKSFNRCRQLPYPPTVPHSQIGTFGRNEMKKEKKKPDRSVGRLGEGNN